MKFPSIKTLAQSAKNTIQRFPFEVLFALAGTIAATVQVELTYVNRIGENWCTRVMMIANLGLLLSLSVSLFIESKPITGSKKVLVKTAAALLSALLIFFINPEKNPADYTRFILLSLSFHLLVAYAAFLSKNNVQGFWQFNKTLFLRFLTAVLYSTVLFLGLSAAIAAMNFLFNFKFEWDTFFILWIWIAGLLSTVFFLAGVPDNFQEINNDFSYPKGLKIFTQYVLIPLATIYVLILLAYEFKILLQWQLPKGLVSDLILAYAVFGILALLLVYPIREKEENKWLKTYSRSFYFLLIPLLVLLFTAMGTRVFNYGLTEKRYFLMLLACWLLLITFYFLFSKKQSIKIIPVSLSLLTLLSVYGPQSAFSVSRYSQQRILLNLFEKNNALVNGRIDTEKSKKMPRKDGNRAAATLDYLVSKHGLSPLQPYLQKDLNAVSDSLSAVKVKGYNGDYVSNFEKRLREFNWAKKYLGLGNFSRYNSDEADYDAPARASSSYSFTSQGERLIKIKGYDYLINLNNISNDSLSNYIDGMRVKQTISKDLFYTITLNNDKASFNIKALMDNIIKSKFAVKSIALENDDTIPKALPDSLLSYTKETINYTVTLKITRLNFNKSDEKQYDYVNLTALYLIKRK